MWRERFDEMAGMRFKDRFEAGRLLAERLKGQPLEEGIVLALPRGGVLVGVSGEARAADALATLHAYGGGNAAIGAWTGRV